MAVGILQIPSLYEPAYNPNYFVVSGSNSPSGNYKLMCRIQAPSGTIVATLKKPTDPIQTTKAVFDVGRIIESYVTHTVDIGIDRVTKATENIQDYLVEFGEEYGTPAAEHWEGIYTYPCFALNIALSPREFNAYDYTDYLMSLTGQTMLNKYKGARKVFTTSKAFLYFLNDETHRVNSIYVQPYDASGNALTVSSIEQPYGGSAFSERCLYVPAGPANLNLIPQAQLFSGTEGQVIPTNCAYYTLRTYNTVLNSFGEELTYTIIDNCSKYTNYPIYFLGQYGNIDMWDFNKRSDTINEITKSDYKTPLGRFLTSTTYGYSDTDRQLTTFNSEVKETVTLNTDILTEAELLHLKECVQSPIVYSLEDGELIPVKVIDTSFVQKKSANEKVFNLTMTIEYASSLELQRG